MRRWRLMAEVTSMRPRQWKRSNRTVYSGGKRKRPMPTPEVATPSARRR